jgi:hypothetical protein
MTDRYHKHYRALELNPGAPLDEVKKAYRLLVKVWHPDRFINDQSLQQLAHQKLVGINQAYDELCVMLSLPDARRSSFSKQSRSFNAEPAGEAGTANKSHPFDRSPYQTQPGSAFKARPYSHGPFTEPVGKHSNFDKSPSVSDWDKAWTSMTAKPKGYSIPSQCYHEAAEQGFGTAQFQLGLLYYHGQGVPRDHIEAYKWFSLAAETRGRDHLKADYYLQRLRSSLTKDQLNLALGGVARK